jgi:hypothetical protein
LTKLPSLKLLRRLSLAALALFTLLSGGCALSNKAPVIVGLEAGEDNLCVTESCPLRVIAYDPDGDDLSYQWSATGGDISADGQTAVWTAPHTPGTYQVSVKVTDGGGAEAETQLSLEVAPNSPPVIDSLSAKRPRANRGEFVVIECLASDADEDNLAYSWSATGGTFYGVGPVIAWEAPLELEAYTIMVTVSDGKGTEASGRLTLEVAVNHSPVIESLTASETVVIFGRSTDITCTASDPDGDVISYFWSATDGEISGEGPAIIWSAPDACGATVAVTVSVVDSRGGETSKDITIWTRTPG